MVNHIIHCGACCSILDVATIFCIQRRLFLWGFQWNFHGIEFVPWNPVESMWNPCGIHVELIIPSSFHMESMMSME